MYWSKVYLLASADAGGCPKTSLQQISKSCPCLQVEALIRCESGNPSILQRRIDISAALDDPVFVAPFIVKQAAT